MTKEDPVVADTLRHTVSFGRKISDGNYGTRDASLFIQFQMPAETPLAEVIREAESMQDVLAAAILERLDIPYTIGEDGRVAEDTNEVLGKLLDMFPGATVVEEPAAAPARTDGVASAPPFDPKTEDPEKKKLNNSWAKARYSTHPGEFFDNANNKLATELGGKGWNPKGPDFTHKTTRLGVWIG